MIRALLSAALVAAIASPPAVRAAPHPRPATAAIPKLTGSVSATNAERFLDAVADRTDKIVGLQIYVEPSTDAVFAATHYLAQQDPDQFVVSKGPPGEIGMGVEMVVPRDEAVWQHGGYVLDGFYLVKSGGVHQGTVSVGLQKVSEAEVLLSNKFRVVSRSVDGPPARKEARQ